MSGKMKVLLIASVFIVGLAVMLLIGPAQGAKPASGLSLKASFEPTWIDGFSSNRIRNDVDGLVYVNTPSTKRAFYGVDVTYTPQQGSFPSQFVMKVDKNGLLGRYVKINFQDPSTDPACDESGYPGFAVDPLQGVVGELETKRIEISTGSVLVRNADGALVRDLNQRLDMDKMQAGQSKLIDLAITFTPTDPLFDREYNLGISNAGQTATACANGYGAELFCTATGSMWEIRPTMQTFVNEPDNVRRLLHTNVQMDFLRQIKLRTWRLPFVLRIWK
jgi:hypothetical protein